MRTHDAIREVVDICQNNVCTMLPSSANEPKPPRTKLTMKPVMMASANFLVRDSFWIISTRLVQCEWLPKLFQSSEFFTKLKRSKSNNIYRFAERRLTDVRVITKLC